MSILELTKLDLQILSDEYDGYIQSLIAASKKAITTEGIVLNEDSVEDSVADDVLISAYARHLYRDRANSNLNSAMPRYLRRMLNDRLFSQKASE